MKKIFCVFLAIFALFGLFSCKEGKKEADGETVADLEFLTANDWVCIDPSAGDTEYFCLNKDMSFSYWCACGDPVDDSDLYDKFKYNEKTGVIKVYNSLMPLSSKKYKLITFGQDFIVLDIGGVLKEFVSDKVEDIADVEYPGDTLYIEGYTMLKTVTEIDGQGITFAPSYYDKDVKKYNLQKMTLDLAENAAFFALTVDHADRGDYYSGVSEEIVEISAEEASKIVSKRAKKAFLWLTKDLEIEKAVFYEYNYYDTFVPDEYREQMEGFDFYLAVTDATETEITVAPAYYDGDVKEHEELKKTLKLAEDVVVESITVVGTQIDTEVEYKVEYEEMTLEELIESMEYGYACAFLWQNGADEVEKILIYGATYISM